MSTGALIGISIGVVVVMVMIIVGVRRICGKKAAEATEVALEALVQFPM